MVAAVVVSVWLPKPAPPGYPRVFSPKTGVRMSFNGLNRISSRVSHEAVKLAVVYMVVAVGCESLLNIF